MRVKSIEFRDYKTFSRFVISARSKNVLVGPNNAGKSTTLDAFRIAFDALRYAGRRSATFRSQEKDGVCSTYEVPQSVIQTDLRYCIHNFGDGFARIEISADNGNSVVLKIPQGGDIQLYLKSDVSPQKNSSFLRNQFPLDIVIVPTLSPLEQNEELVQQATVEKNRYSRLASRNFRNFWLHKTNDEFQDFADLVEIGWPGIRLMKPEIERGGARPVVRMYFRDGPHVREVQWAGFGFQVWMQTMMHLLQADHRSTLILDEPDIYLHPDLQHRLLRLVSQRVGQYFIATHSTEIINDVDPGEVLIVRSGARGAKRIQNESDYPAIYSAIGSSENAQFARLARTQKVLYFEGQDARLLSRVASNLGKMDFISNSSITVMKTDGFSNWSRVATSSWVFKNFFGFDVPVAALFDRDYRCDDEVVEFLSSINNPETACYVLPFKEIENILLVPRAIKAAVQHHASEELPSGWEEIVDNIFNAACDATQLRVLAQRIGSKLNFLALQKSRADMQTVSAEEEKAISEGWPDFKFKRKVVPGKEVFAEIARNIQEKFKVTVTSARVIAELDLSEVDPEIFKILGEIRSHLGE